jgi:hypothetical protein
METISFVLGIVFVVVIGISVVATYAFFKVLKTTNNLESLERELNIKENNIIEILSKGDTELYRRIDNLEREVFSQLDSRLDKLENKLTTKN